MGAGVVVAHLHGKCDVSAGNLEGATVVVVVVDDDERFASGIAPEEDCGNLGRGAGGVDADVQELDSCPGEGTYDAAGVAGDIGHLCADGLVAEAGVERCGEGQCSEDHGGIEHLGLPTEGEGVPRDITSGNGLFHELSLLGSGLFEIFVEEPGAGGPGEAVRSSCAESRGRADGLRVVDVEVFGPDGGLGIGEADIEVALEDDVDVLYVLGRGRGRGRLLRMKSEGGV